MLVLKGIFGGSLKITSEKKTNFQGKRQPQNQGALKVTELRWQRAPKTQIFAEKPQIFADSPLLLEIIWRAQETADFRRKPQTFAENRRKPQIGLRHLRCVTFSSALQKILRAILPAKNHPWILTTLGCLRTPDPRNSSVEKFLSWGVPRLRAPWAEPAGMVNPTPGSPQELIDWGILGSGVAGHPRVVSIQGWFLAGPRPFFPIKRSDLQKD